MAVAAGETDPAAVRREIEAANKRFVDAYNRGDVAEFANVYTEDAVIYPPDMEPIRGKEAITSFWQGGHDQMGIRDVALTTDEAVARSHAVQGHGHAAPVARRSAGNETRQT